MKKPLYKPDVTMTFSSSQFRPEDILDIQVIIGHDRPACLTAQMLADIKVQLQMRPPSRNVLMAPPSLIDRMIGLLPPDNPPERVPTPEEFYEFAKTAAKHMGRQDALSAKARSRRNRRKRKRRGL